LAVKPEHNWLVAVAAAPEATAQVAPDGELVTV
jgi:hypothetical protein